MFQAPKRCLPRIAAGLAGGLLACAGFTSVDASDGPTGWPQWGQNAQHQGFVAVNGQSLNRALAQVTYDPFTAQEKADGGGSLLIHYQTPLVRDKDVFMMFKTGTYTPASATNLATRWNSEVWNERRLRLEHGQLVQLWNFESDWKPEPSDLALGWEPVFHAALAGSAVYVPGLGGTILKVDADRGALLARVNPFGSTVDPSIYGWTGSGVGPLRNRLRWGAAGSSRTRPVTRSG